MKQTLHISKTLLYLFIVLGIQSCTNTDSSLGDCKFLVDPDWLPGDPGKYFKYGLMIRSPWEDGGKLYLNFPEHLEYNPVGNTILRHWDEIPSPWIISPDGKQASYRVESLEAKNVFVESFARSVTTKEVPFKASGVKLAMRIINNCTAPLPVVRPLICMQYNGLTGFPKRLQENYKHNYIIVNGVLTALSDLPTEDIHSTFKGCVVKGCPQHDTRAEEAGGLIDKEMDLALSIVTSLDHKRKVIMWWTPGKSMIANAEIPCLHADPYFGTIEPDEEVYTEGMIIFTEGDIEPIIKYLKGLDKTNFKDP